MRGFGSEHTIQVDRQKLLTTLNANMVQHIADLAEARKVYRERAKDALMLRLADLDAKAVGLDFHDLPLPRSFVKEYEKAIKMVEWEVSDTMELSSEIFEKWVLDNWEWRSQWESSTGTYVASAR